MYNHIPHVRILTFTCERTKHKRNRPVSSSHILQMSVPSQFSMLNNLILVTYSADLTHVFQVSPVCLPCSLVWCSPPAWWISAAAMSRTWSKRAITALYEENKAPLSLHNCDKTLLLFQGCFVLFFASYRPVKGRDISAIRSKFAKSRRSWSEHRTWHVSAGTNHHSRYTRGNPPNRHRIFIRHQKAGDPLYLCLLRGDRQLHRLHDILSGLPVAYTRSNLIWCSHWNARAIPFPLHFYNFPPNHRVFHFKRRKRNVAKLKSTDL